MNQQASLLDRAPQLGPNSSPLSICATVLAARGDLAVIVVVATYSVLIVALGGYGLISPQGIISLVRRFQSSWGAWGAFSIRLVFAIALWFAAPSSATPFAFRVFAVMAFFGAVALPAMGETRFRQFLEWWSKQPAWAIRVWLLVAVAFGLFTLWSSAVGTEA